MSAEDALLGRAFIDSVVEMIEPKKGVYQITPVVIANDYVAVAPIRMQKETSIIVPDEESTIGIIVGVGPLVPEEMRTAFVVGNTVKFSPKQPICNLDGLYPSYGKARVVLVRYHSLLAKVPGEQVMMIGLDVGSLKA